MTVEFLVEVLFLDLVSLWHPGGKRREEYCTLGHPETRRERMYLLFWPKMEGVLSREL